MKNGIVIERGFRATLDEIWELWTTKEGIEAWWIPDAFRVEVTAIVLRAAGYFDYAMIAVAPEMIEFMKGARMKTRTDHRPHFHRGNSEIAARVDRSGRLHSRCEALPDRTRVELSARGNEVQVTMTLSRMHDEIWTGRQRMGWETNWSNWSASSQHEMVCELDLDCIVAKRKTGTYRPADKPSPYRIKIKNPMYSRADRRDELFNPRPDGITKV